MTDKTIKYGKTDRLKMSVPRVILELLEKKPKIWAFLRNKKNIK